MVPRSFRGLANVSASLFFLSVCFGPAIGLGQVPKFTITTVAGSAVAGFSGDGGPATAAALAFPAGIAMDRGGNLYIADAPNGRIRKLATDGTISTIAGIGTLGFSGEGKAASQAQLNRPYGVAFDTAGNIYIADTYNDNVRKITIATGNISTFAGTNTEGLGGDGGAATGALLDTPTGVAVDSAGNVYIADTNNNRIRRVGTDGNISTFAGAGGIASTGDGGPATQANLNNPEAVAVDAAGNVYIADTAGHRIRKVTTDGNITTIAGNGNGGFQGDGGPATQASLYYPKGIALDPSSGNMYIADWLNSRIRVITPDGKIYTAAGNGQYSYYGDGGAATNAALRFPWGVAVDSAGKVYVSDDENSVIRLLTPVAPTSSTVSQGIPQISAGGVISVAAFGGFASVAPGTWVEIHGSSLAANTRSWTDADFHGTQAPTSLDGTTVTIGGQAAYISYISPTQINAEIPEGAGLGSQDVVVTTAGGGTASQKITVNPVQPGLLAPASLNLSGKQYTEALFADGTTFAVPVGYMQGGVSRPARAGETIVLYGIGFGPVSPDAGPGDIVQSDNSLVMSFQVSIGGKPAQVNYAGLAPGSVGLYQFNVVVPDTTPGNAVPLTFSLGGSPGQQVLYTAVQP